MVFGKYSINTWAKQQTFFISSTLQVRPFYVRKTFHFGEKVSFAEMAKMSAIEDDVYLQNCSPCFAFPYADDRAGIPLE